MTPDVAVLHMQDRRPVWSMPAWVPDRIRETLPEGWTLREVDAPADGSGDGAALVAPEVVEAVRGARVYLGFGIPTEVLEAGTELEWVHSGSAGVGGSLTPALRESDVVFTNSAGIHGPPMAETVVAMLLHFFRGLDFAVRGQRRGRWWPDPFYAPDTPVTELADAVVGVVGYGGVGREVARRVSTLGARVLALRRHPPEEEDAHAEVVHGEGAFHRLLSRSDAVVVTLPETDETRGMLDADAFAAMKEGALVVNVARGGVVDEGALLEALISGRLRGAGLDVYATEPLPADHPLWEMENVVMTPHVSAVTRRFWERECELIVKNFSRFFEGREMVNVVDVDLGY